MRRRDERLVGNSGAGPRRPTAASPGRIGSTGTDRRRTGAATVERMCRTYRSVTAAPPRRAERPAPVARSRRAGGRTTKGAGPSRPAVGRRPSWASSVTRNRHFKTVPRREAARSAYKGTASPTTWSSGRMAHPLQQKRLPRRRDLLATTAPISCPTAPPDDRISSSVNSAQWTANRPLFRLASHRYSHSSIRTQV